jgi:predicted dehydrogenase
VAAKTLGVKQAFADYRQMMDKAKPDIVAICQRWVDQHAEMAIEAANRGIHIFMEKPFVPSLEQADAVVKACEKNHVKFALGHPTRYSPKLDTIATLIKEGKIGRVLEYRARGKEDRRGGGEDLWVLGTHLMDMILALGGKPQWCFAYLTQAGEPVSKKHVAPGAEGLGPLAGDGLRAMYGMPDGSTASFYSYQNAAGNPSRYGLMIHGSRGVIELLEGPMPSVKFLGDPSWSPGRTGSKWQDVSSAGIGQPEPLTGSEYTARYTLGILDFLAAIEADRQPENSVYAARDATEMILAAFESHRLGRPVDLPLKNRQHPLTMLS